MRPAIQLGTITTVSSPRAQKPQPLGDPELRRQRPLVLIADDEPGIVDFLRFALEDHGYRVVTARDGAEALTEVRRERPDFVLTDLMMPCVDGWELCSTLRRDDETHDLPIVGMSAVDPRGAPFDAFLRKPFELDALLAALERLSTGVPSIDRSLTGSSPHGR
jgi:CheY-like chemotaxis protein